MLTAGQKARRLQNAERRARKESMVPDGMYCYSRDTVTGKIIACPHLKIRKDRRQQSNGYCRLLKVGDYTQGKVKCKDGRDIPRATFLLWDACKECGIRDDP